VIFPRSDQYVPFGKYPIAGRGIVTLICGEEAAPEIRGSRGSRPALRDILPKIEEAQRTGPLLRATPFTSVLSCPVLSSLGSEIQEIARIEPDAPGVVDAYWKLADMAVFGRQA
jgi:hypothetical protein